MNLPKNFVLIEGTVRSLTADPSTDKLLSLSLIPSGNQSGVSIPINTLGLYFFENDFSPGQTIRVLGHLYLNRAEPLQVVAHSIDPLMEAL